MRGVGGYAGNFRYISGKFPVKCVVIRKREIDLVNREIKIFTKFLQKNNPQIMLSSPVKYLRKYNFYPIQRFFPIVFIYIIQVYYVEISVHSVIILRRFPRKILLQY